MVRSEPLQVAVHGLGWVAGAHIETFEAIEGADVVAACSRRELDAEALEAEYGRPITPYDSYEELLAEDAIDVVDICSPSHVHAEQAIQAAEAGKDIILEKPIALSWSDAKRVREAVHDNDVSVCVCFEVRFSDQADTLRSTIDQDLLGNLHYAEVDYYHGVGPWYGQFSWNVKEDGGGSSLLSAGCHALDLLLYYMDGEVEEVTTYSTSTDNEQFEPYEYDTTTTSLLQFDDGRVGKVASVIDCLQPYYFRMHLVGGQGTVLDDKFYTTELDGLDREDWSEFGVPVVDSGDVEHHPYLPQFRAFIDALDADEAMPRTDFETALESHRVIFAADRSAAENRPVAIDEFERS